MGGGGYLYKSLVPVITDSRFDTDRLRTQRCERVFNFIKCHVKLAKNSNDF